jgi:ubiquinone/menaquinone biosynthesis C-methylase UbiE
MPDRPARLKAETVELLAVESSDRVLDVGCGTGDDAVVIGTVAPDVVSIGVDLSSRNLVEDTGRG